MSSTPAPIRTTNLPRNNSVVPKEVLVHSDIGGVLALLPLQIEYFVQFLVGLAGLDPSIVAELSLRLNKEIADRASGDQALRTDLNDEISRRAMLALQGDYLTLKGVADLRGLPTPPIVGLVAFPNTASVLLPYVRASGATRVDDRLRIAAVASGEIPHEYDRESGIYLGWRIDPAATNLATLSEDYTQAVWTKARATVSADLAVAPDGTVTADKILETTENGAHGITRSFPITAGLPYGFSIFYLPGERTKAYLQLDGGGFTNPQTLFVDLVTASVYSVGGSLVRSRVERAFGGWIRISLMFTAPATGNVRVVAAMANDAGAGSYAGDTSKGLYLWGAQFENGQASSSYIPAPGTATVARAVTRARSASLPARDSGALVARFRFSRVLPSGAQRVAGIFAAFDNRVHISINPDGRVYLGCVFDGQSITVSGPVVPIGSDVIAVACWEPGRQSLAVNGTLYAASAPSANALNGPPIFVVGTQEGALDPLYGTISEALLLPRPMADTKMVAISSGAVSGGSGGSGGSDTPTYAASLHRVEIASDPSKDMTLVWHAPTGSPHAVEYRALGSTSWMSTGAVSKAFPASSERVFFATVAPPSPPTEGSIYEWRAAGTGLAGIRRFRLLPSYRARSLRLAVVSDWQRNSANALNEASYFNVLNNLVATRGADIVLIGGDYTNDNGLTSATLSQTWRDFIGAWASRWVDADGCLKPICAIAGNHEANAQDGALAGAQDGKGTYGYMDKVFSTFYRPGVANATTRGYGWFEVGTELLVIGLETNHATPIAEQVPWIRDLLAARGSRYRHIIVMGHIGPYGLVNEDWGSPAPKTMREQILPIVQQYPQAIFVHGHCHVLSASRRVRFVENPAGGVNAWTEIASGIRCLGSGGWDMPDFLPFNVQDQASSTTLGDGSKLIEYLVASNQPPRGVAPISNPNNTENDPATKHIWEIDLNETSLNAKAMSLNNTVLINLTEPNS